MVVKEDKPSSKQERARNPRDGAGFLSAATFAWTLPIFRHSDKFFKNLNDIYDPLEEDNSKLLGDQLEKAWNEEIENSKKKNSTPSLLKTYFRVHKKNLVLSGLMIFIVEFVFRLMTPLCLIEFINYFDKKEKHTISRDLFLASTIGLVLSPFFSVFLNHGYHFVVFHMGMKMRVAISSLIYRKVLSMPRSTLSEISTGHIINLLSNDAGRFDFVGSFFFDILIGPLQIIIIAYCLWNIVGSSCLIGISVIVLSIPFTVWLGKKVSVLRLKTALRTDDRVRIMSEIIIGIQVIKMYIWEKPFEILIESVRRKEVDAIKKVSYIRGILYSLPMFHTRTATFLTLVTYVLTGNDITPSKAFVLTSFINVLQLTVADYFPQGASQIAEFLISVKRIEKFLLSSKEHCIKAEASVSPDLPSDPSNSPAEECGITLKNVNAKWVGGNRKVLSDISLEVKPGQLTAVIGSVGAGKTSLFYTLLKELEIINGNINLPGRVSYASQEPWLFPASIKENILFGERYDGDKFKEVIKACALDKDLDGFMHGEKTLVAERGVSLSGGQKARISLARAVYKDADIYLLDDPLSAVDTNVQKHLFEKCIRGWLKNKVVLLITHQLQYLKDVSQIVVLENGMIKCMGNYELLQQSGFDFSTYLRRNHSSDEADIKIKSTKLDRKNDDSELIVETEYEVLANAEEINKKDLNLNVYWTYFKPGGNVFVLFVIFIIFLSAQVAASGSDYWTSYWVNLENHVFPENKTDLSKSVWVILSNYPSRSLCIYIFLSLILSNIVLSLLRSCLFFSICMKSSQKLHNKMFKAVSRSPMIFFNENPSGRILNRFSKDVGNIDEILPSSMLSCFQIIIAAVGIFFIVPSTNVWLLVPTFAVLILFFLLRKLYLRGSCVIKRIEGIARSPIYTHLSSSLQGLTTVHALKAEDLLNRQFDQHQDRHSATWYSFIASGRAICLWLDIVCALYNALVTMSFLLMKSSSLGGNVGLAITQTTALTSSLQWGMRQSAEVENHMTSVERIREYTKLEEEQPFESSPEKKPHNDWPNEGKITFVNVSLRYSPNSSWVLNDLSFTIFSGQKVGVVGRTGAGKSSLIAALFRLFEVKGRIEIDGVDITAIGLWDVRSKISVIPQDPVLFTGTLRYNLDPFKEFSDDVLWQALEEVELKNYINGFEDGLQLNIHEGGSNLSIGQRQLLALARAIVRGNRILILDEPTANVDTRTDSFIQETIRKKFVHCTVITIAHRMNSIMDSDVIMVMDFGKLVEFGNPYLLLQNNHGHFYDLAAQTGCMTDLYAVAYEHFVGGDSLSEHL